LGFANISVSAKTADFIGLSRCWQNTVIVLTHPDNLLKKAEQSKLRQLSCSNVAGAFSKKKTDKMNHGTCISHRSRNQSIIINQINQQS